MKSSARKTNMAAAILIGIAFVILLVVLRWGYGPAENPLAEVLLSNTTRTNELLYCVGETNAFAGFVVEYYENGGPKSRTQFEDGVLNGISEGWHTNNVLQVREYFTNGVAHGKRIKWHANGQKQSEVMIAAGKLEGTFHRWHENGTLAQEINLAKGIADGASRSWYPSGYAKARAVLKTGEVLEQQFYDDGKVQF